MCYNAGHHCYGRVIMSPMDMVLYQIKAGILRRNQVLQLKIYERISGDHIATKPK